MGTVHVLYSPDPVERWFARLVWAIGAAYFGIPTEPANGPMESTDGGSL